ncbi:DUF1036 domain-containing protein [uncultured Paracoccus sp.]|uniref:DUF1036 domain-containing protein n=1 Tax=uncultured Paracoccus sp. TaxID=189685 RepID=UPI0025D96CF4|nr:DUF1036 domain-containing protein [uncultured Paracoccus sp.]
MRGFQLFSAVILAGAALWPVQGKAAQFTACAGDIGVRIAYGQRSDRGWVTKGWVRINAGDCQVVSVTTNKPIDLRLLALREDGSGPVITSRLAETTDTTDPIYMRDEELVCGAENTDFESVGVMVISALQSCTDGLTPMVLPIRVLVPADTRFRLSF